MLTRTENRFSSSRVAQQSMSVPTLLYCVFVLVLSVERDAAPCRSRLVVGHRCRSDRHIDAHPDADGFVA